MKKREKKHNEKSQSKQEKSQSKQDIRLEREQQKQQEQEWRKVSTAIKLQAEVDRLEKRLWSEKIVLNNLDIQGLLSFRADYADSDFICCICKELERLLDDYRQKFPSGVDFTALLNKISAMPICITKIVTKMKDFLQKLLEFNSKELLEFNSNEKNLLEFKQDKGSLINEIISFIPDDSKKSAVFIQGINKNIEPINQIFEYLGIGLLQILKFGQATFKDADCKTLPGGFFCQALQLIYNEWEGLCKLKFNGKDLNEILEKFQKSGLASSSIASFKDYITYELQEVLQGEGLDEKEDVIFSNVPQLVKSSIASSERLDKFKVALSQNLAQFQKSGFTLFKDYITHMLRKEESDEKEDVISNNVPQLVQEIINHGVFGDRQNQVSNQPQAFNFFDEQDVIKVEKYGGNDFNTGRNQVSNQVQHVNGGEELENVYAANFTGEQ